MAGSEVQTGPEPEPWSSSRFTYFREKLDQTKLQQHYEQSSPIANKSDSYNHASETQNMESTNLMLLMGLMLHCWVPCSPNKFWTDFLPILLVK